MGTVAGPAPKGLGRSPASRAGHPVVSAVLTLAAIALAVGAASFVVATDLASSTAAQLQVRIGSLQAQLAAAQHELATDAGRIARVQSRVSALGAAAPRGGSGAATSIVAGLQSDVTSLRGAVWALDACVPQLARELGGVTLVTDARGGVLTAARLANGSPLSAGCAGALQAAGH